MWRSFPLGRSESSKHLQFIVTSNNSSLPTIVWVQIVRSEIFRIQVTLIKYLIVFPLWFFNLCLFVCLFVCFVDWKIINQEFVSHWSQHAFLELKLIISFLSETIRKHWTIETLRWSFFEILLFSKNIVWPSIFEWEPIYFFCVGITEKKRSRIMNTT